MSERDDAAAPVGLRCLGCGYDLRGLRRDGRCPECGRDVAESLAAFEGPRVTASVAGAVGEAAWLLVAATVGSLLCVGGTLFVVAKVALGGPQANSTYYVVAAGIVVTLLLSLGGRSTIAAVVSNVDPPRRRIGLADVVGGVGMLNLAAAVLLYEPSLSGIVWFNLVFGFGLLAATSWRSVRFYRNVANIQLRLEGTTSDARIRGGTSLGWAKLVVDGGLTGSMAFSLLCGEIYGESVAVVFSITALLLLPIWAIVALCTLAVHLRLADLATRFTRQVTSAAPARRGPPSSA